MNMNCKKGIGLVVLFLLTALPAISQSRGYFSDEDDTREFYGGIVLGGNFSQVDGDTYAGYKKAGLNTGAIVYARFSPSLLGSIEFLYSQKGARGIKVTESSYTGTSIDKYYLDLNYVEVPIVINLVMTSQLVVGIGGAYGRLLKSNEDVLTGQPVFLDPLKYPFRKEDYSIVFDGGFQIGNGLFLKGRFQYSMKTIRDPAKVPPGYGQGNVQFNNIVSLRLMYLIGK